MKKSSFVTLLLAASLAILGLAACGQAGTAPSDTPSTHEQDSASEAQAEQPSDESTTEAETDGAAYGYAGTDPVEAAVYRYLVVEVSQYYEKAEVSIPVVQIVHVDDTNPDEVAVYGSFWIENYNIKGDTLECVSGGSHPGVMHLRKDGGSYVVSSFDVVADGADFDASARELFGEYYDAFAAVLSDSETREAVRTATISDYVNLNGLAVTQYQDYGWDPVQLSN